MTQPNSTPEKPGVTFQPPCPMCGHPMWLTRLSPVGKNEDMREFECQVCSYTESRVVKFK